MQGPSEPSSQTQREADEATRRIERTLEQALPVPPPPGLSDRLYHATADAFVRAGLHRENAPPSDFEAEPLHAEPGSLAHNHRSGAPAHDGPADETSLAGDFPAGDNLADELLRALDVTPPPGLADRVYQSSVIQAGPAAGSAPLGSPHRGESARSEVLGRVGPLLRIAGAAAVLALVAVGVWATLGGPYDAPQIASNTSTNTNPAPGNGASPAIEPGAPDPRQGDPAQREDPARGTPGENSADRDATRIVQQIERSLQAPVAPIDTQIMAVSAELDQLAQAVESDHAPDAILEATGRSLDRSYMIEGRIGAF